MTLLIDGKWIEGEAEEFSSINPANQEIIWTGKAATKAQVQLAVIAARKASKTWMLTSFEERQNIIEKFTEILKAHKAEVSKAISEDNGKSKWEADLEVDIMIGKFKATVNAFADRASTREKQISEKSKSIVRHKPHGVVVIYGPYNFPGHVPNGHIMPALLAGNTIVFKPSELIPYSSELMIKLWQEAGLPDGVINLVQGAREVGEALVASDDIDGIFFTGSSKIGKLLHSQLAGNTSKIIALEMGGNNPLVVNDVSDIKAAAYTTIQSAFITSGQRCTCARRLIVPEGNQGNTFIEELVRQTKTIKVGAYDQEAIFIGPLISKEAATKVLVEQDKLIERGAKAILKAKRIDASGSETTEETAFIQPGIIDSTSIAEDQKEDFEIFGPVLQIFRTKDFSSAIAEANNTAYGLSAGLLSDSEELYQEFYSKIKAGLVNWNQQITGASGANPFGGVGDSGNFRPSAYYACDYSCYPVSSLESTELKLPEKLSPGIEI